MARKLSLIFICILFIKPYEGIVQNIKIGAIFHEGDELLEAVFDEALKDLENEQNSFFTLKSIKRTNVELDSFKTSSVVCELLDKGVAAIFGPSHYQTRYVVSSIAARFHIPHIEFTFHQKDEQFVSLKSVNVYPSSRVLENAIAEAVKHMNWHAYTYIYQTNDALSRIQVALQNEDRQNYPVTIKELMPLSKINLLPDEKSRKHVYESLVKQIQASAQNSILIDVEKENLSNLLDTMNKMGLMSDYFMCLIISLDAAEVNIEQFISKDTVANITRFKFIKDEESSMTFEAALLYDSVFAFNEALINLYKNVISSGSRVRIVPRSLSCQGEEIYEVGLNITDILLKKTKYGMLTGLMTFDDEGERIFEFDIINTQAGRTVKVGEWNGEQLIITRNEKELNNTLTEAAKSKIFKVSTRVGPPYVMVVDDEAKGRSIGDKKYEGYCIDLIAKIEEFLGIRCEFEIVPDGKYGSLNPRTKQWDGLIKQLLELKADFAICDLTITSERQSAVDFTAPFMNLGISILFSKAEKEVPKLFAFMDPLSTEVWMYTVTAYLIVSLMLFFQARIAPGEWMNPHPCNPDPEELENNFTLMNSMWLTMGSLMQQGSDILPVTPSIRMIAGMWWFFVLIMVSSYTANLAAFLTATKQDDSINDIDDLAKQSKISYGALKDGSTYSFFKNSNTTLYQRIFNIMNEAKPSVFTKSNDEGVERVIKGRKKYAFFMESTSIEYQIERHCELQMVGSLLDNKGYGIAMPPNSPYRTMISTAILRLQEKGELQQLKEKWWKEMGGGQCKEESDETENSDKLGMSHVGGVFLVLMLGCVISVFIAIVEFLWNVRAVAVEEKITQWEALVQELKFVINISVQTKPVKSAKSRSKSTSVQANSLNKSLSGLNKSDFDLNKLDIGLNKSDTGLNKSDTVDSSRPGSLHKIGRKHSTSMEKK